MTDVLAMVKAILATTATRWLNMTEALPIDLLNRQPTAGEWSATACLIHLLDTEHIFPARVQALLTGQAIPAFDPDTQGTKETTSSPVKLATEFASLRQSSLAVLERLLTLYFGTDTPSSQYRAPFWLVLWVGAGHASANPQHQPIERAVGVTFKICSELDMSSPGQFRWEAEEREERGI